MLNQWIIGKIIFFFQVQSKNYERLRLVFHLLRYFQLVVTNLYKVSKAIIKRELYYKST